jgi:PKD repeat protein
LPFTSSTDINPLGLSYSTSGDQVIELWAYASSGNVDTDSQIVTVTSNIAPDVDFSTDNFCLNVQNNFSGISSSKITSWSWDFGDGVGSATGQNPSYLYLSTGDYNVTLTVVSDLGCTNNITKQVSIFNSPLASFTPPVSNLCSSTELLFTNTSALDSGSPITWEWDFGDGTPVSNDISPIHTYTAGAMYSVSLTATLANGCISTDTQMIKIEDGPTVDFDWTGNCWESGIGSNVQFDNLSETTDVTYSWDFGDGSPLDISFEPVHLYDTPSDYDVELTVTSTINGCESKIVKQVIVSDQPISDFTFGSAVENIPVQFTGLDQTGPDDFINSWSWDFDGLGTSTDQNPLLFDVSTTVCLEENILLTNTSINATNYNWDFCFDALSHINTAIDLGPYNDATNPEGITIEYDGGDWYGFLLGRDNNKLIRLEFGSDLSNVTPVVTDLDNLSGLIAGPVEIRLVKESGNWYGLLINLTGNKLTRLDFGTSLTNTPTGVDLGNLSSWTTVRGLDIVWDGTRWIGVVTAFGNNKVTMLDFGVSIVNNSPTVLDVAVGNPLFSGLFGIGLQSDGTNWYGLLSSFTDDKILYLDYSSDLMTDPSVTEIGTYDRCTGISFEKDADEYYGFIAGSGGLTRITFGDELVWDGDELIEDLGNFGILGNEFGLSAVKDVPDWRIFSIAQSTKEISRIDFEDVCLDLSLTSSTDINPSGLNYSTSGDQVIELWAYASNGNVDKESQIVTVSSDNAPDIDFTTDNSCIDSPNIFTPVSSGTLTSWSWDFGDSSTSSESSPIHQYGSTGTYTVRLTVNDGTCSNFIEKDITIYNPPTTSFTAPVGIICSNNVLTFTNTSTFDVGSPVTWEWDFGDQSAVSSEQSATHTYSAGGNYTVTLTATMPNCVDVFTQDITIEEGPATAFSFDNSCDGFPISFVDQTTSASPLTGWAWDFGDGSTSNLQNPVYTYTNPGSYQVTLTTTNDLGCVTTLTQTVSNHANPVASFFNQLACSDTETFFFDQSTVEGANIVAWEWDFGDPEVLEGSAISSEQSPTHIYNQPGIYTVSLNITSNFGCVDSISQDITVTESPTGAFTWDQSCLGEATQFTDLSTPSPVSPIANWTWMIDGEIIEEQNPTYTFPTSGDYPVSLTVTAEDFCLSTYYDTLHVNPRPVASFGYTLACQDSPVTFFDTSETLNDPIVSREWTIGEEFTFSDDSVVTITPNISGEYEITLSVTTENNCTSIIIETVDISSLPSAGFETNTSLGAYPLTIDFTNTSDDASSYGWSFDLDTLQSTEQNPVYTFINPGDYEVTLISLNDTGCSPNCIRLSRDQMRTVSN